MVAKGWCENCQCQSRNGALYCSQCGEELQNKQQPDIKIMFVGLAIVLAWLLFWALWLFFYASGFSILQKLRGLSVIPCRSVDIRDLVNGSIRQETTPTAAKKDVAITTACHTRYSRLHSPKSLQHAQL
ncbi:MAG: hypothetical protein WCB79_10190 [Halobacteriota archaeon]